MPITIDKTFEIPIYSSVCTLCRHLQDIEAHRCLAFDKIPDIIWLGDNDHTEPYPGDNGIQFEPVDDAPKEPINAN